MTNPDENLPNSSPEPNTNENTPNGIKTYVPLVKYLVVLGSVLVYWLFGWLVLVGFFAENPTAQDLLVMDLGVLNQFIRDNVLDDIADMWKTLFFVLLRVFGGGFGFLGCLYVKHDSVLIAIVLTVACFVVKLPFAILYVYAWSVTDTMDYFAKASADFEVLVFDAYIIGIMLGFLTKIKRKRQGKQCILCEQSYSMVDVTQDLTQDTEFESE